MTDASLPVIMTAAGAVPTPPATIRDKLVQLISASNPGYTANLPASMIEDMLSTETAGIAEIDSARVDSINSFTPYGVNVFLLRQLGSVYGVNQGDSTNTSVFVVFSGTVGYGISIGFTISDGSHQYTVQDGGIIQSNGMTQPLFCLATQPGSWAVPENTVTTLITSVPSEITLSVTNPADGLPSQGAESDTDYQAQVLQAGLAASQGMTRYLKTLLGNVPGVQNRLVSVRQSNGGWEIIVGGGDPYDVAYAIYQALFDINTVVGSTLEVTGITNANPGVVTTNLNHGLSNGNVIVINGVVGMSGINNINLTVTVITEKTFSIGVNTTSSGAYVSGGVVTPNPRNLSVSILDYPDTYVIPIVLPPQQSVAVALTWNTTAINIVADSAVAAAGAIAIANYINSIQVGLPIILYELQTVFQLAVADIIPPSLLTRMVFSVDINGVGTPPESGTGIIAGDPESYFLTNSSQVIITRG